MMNRENWYARLQAWKRKTEEKYRDKWWFWPILFTVALFWDAVHEETRAFLASRSGRLFGLLGSMAAFFNPVTLSVLLSLLVLVGLAVHAYVDVSRQAKRPQTVAIEPLLDADAPAPPRATSPQKPMAPRESVEQLRQLFQPLVQCTGTAMAYLKQKFLLSAQPEEHAKLVSRLLEAFVAPSFEDTYRDLYARLEKVEFDESEFIELVDAFNQVTAKYVMVTTWILWAGRVFYKDEFREQYIYSGWYRAHEEFVEAIRRIRGRHDLRRIEQALPNLVNLLPAPKEKTQD